MARTPTLRAYEWDFRLLPDSLQRLGVEPHGIIHVGAHWGEEVPVYLECGFQSITLVEPDPKSCDKMKQQSWYNPDYIAVVNVAIAAEVGTADFYQLNEGNGIWDGLKLNTKHGTLAAVTNIPTAPLSVIQRTHPANVLVIDTQGTEIEALGSADQFGVDLVIIETQNVSADSYAAYWPDLIKFATDNNWEPALIWDRRQGYTDTLLVPKK